MKKLLFIIMMFVSVMTFSSCTALYASVQEEPVLEVVITDYSHYNTWYNYRMWYVYHNLTLPDIYISYVPGIILYAPYGYTAGWLPPRPWMNRYHHDFNRRFHYDRPLARPGWRRPPMRVPDRRPDINRRPPMNNRGTYNNHPRQGRENFGGRR